MERESQKTLGAPKKKSTYYTEVLIVVLFIRAKRGKVVQMPRSGGAVRNANAQPPSDPDGTSKIGPGAYESSGREPRGFHRARGFHLDKLVGTGRSWKGG